ncbi:transposon protein, partial [Striga asiatica]
MMGAINPPDEWPHVDVHPLQPPPHCKMSGRQKKNNRRKAPDEVQDKLKQKKEAKVKLSKKGTTVKCSLCHKENHNMRGCPLKKLNHSSQQEQVATTEAKNKGQGKKRKISDGENVQSEESFILQSHGTQVSHSQSSIIPISSSGTMKTLGLKKKKFQMKRLIPENMNNQKKTLWRPPE